MSGSILTLNAGSSSLKFALFGDGDEPAAKVRGEIKNLEGAPHLLAFEASGAVLAERCWQKGGADPFGTGLEALLEFTAAHQDGKDLSAVGHRVVQGGADHIQPEVVTPDLISALQALTSLDPLHMPRSLAAMLSMAATRPSLTQVACFDTAFHHTLPSVATRFALPRAISDSGVRRYGFHGLSCEYIVGRLAQTSPQVADGRVIVAHLGAGASLCAVLNGRSLATTTGFSALEGLVMATRCGSIDAGALLYLGSQGHSFAEIEDILYNRSGLLGVSGISSDIQVLLDSDDPHAKEAVELFVYTIALDAGAMVSALGGLDGIVFTAGIGEHAVAIRADVCDRLAWLGVLIDPVANALDANLISTPGSAVEVHVIATDEEAMIARHTRAIVSTLIPPEKNA